MTETFTVRMELGGAGPTIAIKDSIDIGGYPTTCGSRSMVGRPAAAVHAEVVERLLARGWKIVGKANMHELAFGVTGINDFAGTPVNPQDAALVPGGSSGGSAVAVGAREADAALGTDTGGSIRIPAACCGVYGLKPTFGRVSRRGVTPVRTSLDCVGPFARDMTTLVSVMEAIDPLFPDEFRAESKAACGARRVRKVSIECAPQILQAIDRVLQASSWEVESISLGDLRDPFWAGLTVINAEMWSAFGSLLIQGQLGADVEERLRLAERVTPAELEAAEAVRHTFSQSVDTALDGVDALVLPTLPSFPPTIEAVRSGFPAITLTSLVRPFNLSGHPALTIPIPTSTGIKAGLQLIGRRGGDAALCVLGAELEQALRGLEQT